MFVVAGMVRIGAKKLAGLSVAPDSRRVITVMSSPLFQWAASTSRPRESTTMRRRWRWPELTVLAGTHGWTVGSPSITGPGQVTSTSYSNSAPGAVKMCLSRSTGTNGSLAAPMIHWAAMKSWLT
jgi:hypothetical protein